MSGEAVRRRLMGVGGIGPSTARYLAAFSGHFDAVSVDSAVISFFARAHAGGRRPSPRQVEEHFGRYGDQAGRVCWFEVWRDYREQRGEPLPLGASASQRRLSHERGAVLG